MLSVLYLVGVVPLLTLCPSVRAQGCHNVKNFTQSVDHTDPSNHATFPQQYQLNLTSYKPGGPILFHQGSEGSSMFCIEDLELPSWATELNAAVATLEHRFFGASIPAGNSTADRFKTLTLDNVMLDSVKFVDWVKSTIPGGQDSKVIAQGDSYGASVSTWLRTNHGQTFYGAISSGPALRALGFSSDDPDNYNWQNHISRVYYRESAESATKIREAFLDLEQLITTTEGRSQLQTSLNLCSAPNSTSSAAPLISLIQTTFGYASQFNYAGVTNSQANSGTFVGFQIPMPLQVLLGRLETIAANDTLSILNAGLSLYMDQFPGCVEYSTGSPPFPSIDYDIFTYITCSWLPISDISTRDGIFPSIPINATVSERQLCKESYNVTVPTQQDLQKRYHFTKQDIENTDRLLFVEGGYDPTSSIGPSWWDFGPNCNSSQILYVPDMAHCEDSLASSPGDRTSVIRARQEELQIVKGWLGMD